jgi:hypothetical protein
LGKPGQQVLAEADDHDSLPVGARDR